MGELEEFERDNKSLGKNLFTAYRGSHGADDDSPRFKIYFDTQEQLLENPYFSKNSKEPGFKGYYLSNSHLMVVWENGKKWWVLGTIEKPELLNLPKWRANKF